MTQRPSATFVFGLAIAGRAVASALRESGATVYIGDDKLNDEHRAFAQTIGAHIVEHSTSDAFAQVMREVEILAPAPGVPENHAVIHSAREFGVQIQSEIEIGYRMESKRLGDRVQCLQSPALMERRQQHCW